MTLLLLLGAGSGAGAAPDVYGVEAMAGDFELWLTPPIDGSTGRVRVDNTVTDIRLQQVAFNQHTLEVKARLGTPICTTTDGVTSALAAEWSQWVLSLYVRGDLVFDGPVEASHVVWGGSLIPGATWENPGSVVTLTALDWVPALLRRRVIQTSVGSTYSATDTPNRIAADLIQKNCCAGTVVEPSGWQTASETREDLGLYALTCSTPTAAGTSTTFKADAGDNVLDTVLELCNHTNSEADWLWPVATRSGTSVAITFLRGRTGGARQIGTDRTTTGLGGGPISAERGNLIAYERTVDRTQREDHVRVTGKGRAGAGQLKTWKANQTAIAVDGIYEGMSTVPDGSTSGELEAEAQRIVNERSTGHRQHKVVMRELSGAQWPGDFQLGDNLPIYTPLGELVSLSVTGIEWSITAPGPAMLAVILGTWPRLEARDLGRAGGGGSGGGRGGGGRSRNKSGNSDTDPDDIKGFPTVTGQTGADAVADSADDTIDFAGYDTADYVRVYTHTADDPETVKDEVRGTYTAGAISANGWVWLRTDTGTFVKLLAEYGTQP